MINANLKLAMCLFFFGFVSSAMAGSYRLDFYGTATNSNESFSGYVIMDYSTPNDSNEPGRGSYENAVTAFEINFGGSAYTLDQNDINGVSVSNDSQFFGHDAFSISLYVVGPQESSGSELFFLQLIDPSMTAFDGVALPTSLALEDFDVAQSSIVLTAISTQFSHQLEFVSLTQVPLPGALVLLLSGLTVSFARSGYSRQR